MIAADRLAELLGPPVKVAVLKDKPGRRRTARATGSRRSAIVKEYVSERAATVGARVAALAAGPVEPIVPEVLQVDTPAHTVVLSDVPGVPLRLAILDGDEAACRRAGAALGRWHSAWFGIAPPPLDPHPIERELDILARWMGRAPAPIATAVEARIAALAEPWPCPTVVHRDLYEEQILLGERVGLIDLDDAALGPPELDAGNLWAHADLLLLRSQRPTVRPMAALLDAYRECGPTVDDGRLVQCRRLALVRLACIHAEPALLDLTDAWKA